jgi:uncharacterized membrane-anchored protein YitT (DUF2179 family)
MIQKWKINEQNSIVRMIILIVSLTLSAIVYNLFLLPLSLVTGGTSGIATITNYLYDINPALMIFLLLMACIIISLLYLGIEKTMATVLVSILYPLLVQATSFLRGYIDPEVDTLLLVLFAGVLGGVSNGLIYRIGYNSGGTTVISQILYEKKKISIAKSSFVISTMIVLLGSFFFGTTNALYAVIYLYINNLVTDKVLLGISNNKAFYIITSEEEKVKEYIIDYMKHDVTVFDVKGGYNEQKRKVLLTVIPSREYYRVTEGIKQIDPKVFFVVTDSYQVEGGK